GFDHIADAADAGIVEQHVDALEPPGHFGCERLGLRLIGDICVLGDGISPTLLDAGDGGSGALVIDVSDDDASALRCKKASRGLADPRAGAGDDANLVLKPSSAHARFARPRTSCRLIRFLGTPVFKRSSMPGRSGIRTRAAIRGAS